MEELKFSFDDEELDALRSKIAKLEETNSKLSNVEAERRKLELEVNYWKEYVTNSQNARRSGQVVDSNTDLADARKQLIQVQDELNETNKRFKTQSGKLVIQNKELSNMKEKLLEAKSIAAVYKAKNEQLTAELSRKNGTVSPSEDLFVRTNQKSLEEESTNSTSLGAQHLEEKFLVLKDRLKRIERELYLKSKELEKANESRSKVAKYTRSLLQELEARLGDAEAKCAESEKKLSNAQAELALERERRLKQEDGTQKRFNNIPVNESKASSERTNTEDSKYADYYRSRYKEVEASLLEKDKQLHEAEQKIKELQQSVKSNSDNYKVIADLQNKLSDATHKLSDRQLKIHELTREIDNLKCIESTYERKSKQCETLEDIVKDLEAKISDHKKNFHAVKQELEMLRIREVVLKEQLQTVAQESDFSEEDEDDKNQLQKSVEIKKKIDNLIQAECLVKKLTLDKENLENKNKELESRLRKINIESFKNIESAKLSEGRPFDDNEKEEYKNRLKELETRVFEADDKYLNKIRVLKEEHQEEINHILDKQSEEKVLFHKEIEKIKQDFDRSCKENETLTVKCREIEAALNEAESKALDEIKSHTNTKQLLEERSCLLKEIEERCKRVTIERDTLKMQYQRQDSADNHELSEETRNEINRLPNKNNETKDTTDSRGRNLAPKRDRLFSSDDEIFITPKTSVSSEPDAALYKTKCKNYEKDLTDLRKLLVSSEQSSISLAQDLENQLKYQNDLLVKYETLECRMSEIENLITDSQDTLQLKADELEKERKNVLYLVDVTSAYIKKLETSLAESKAKVQELQNFIEISKEGKRPQPEGRSDLSDYDEDSENFSQEQWKAIKQKLTAKIMMLESNLSELQANKDNSQNIQKSKKDFQNAEEMQLEIEQLEKELQAQEAAHQKEVDLLQEHFQAELKAAFSGDTGTYDMLNRIQELEICLEETRAACNNKIKEMKQEFEQEKEQMKDDMATVLHASLGSAFDNNSEARSGTVEELEERIMKLEEQLIEQKEKFEEELQLEKDAHTQDMEDTIRDMMMVRNASTRYDGSDDSDVRLTSTLRSSDELEELKLSYESKIQTLNEEHEDQLEQVRQDMAIIVSSITQGRSSDTIMELQSRIKELEMDMEDMRADRIAEVEELRLNLKRAESATFFANRRNEDMGSKIYNMQNEMEEMERKHQMIVQSYQEKLESLGVDVNVAGDAMKFHKELEEKNKQLQLALDRICKERDLEMDAFVMRLQEEKRQAIQEATDNALRLEELINEMKSVHEQEKRELQQSLLPERSDGAVLRKRIEELEITCESLKEEYEEEIEELSKEHKKEVEKLRLFYEKEISEIKRGPSARKTSVDQGSLTKCILKEQKEKHEKEMENLRQSFELERRQAKIVQEREIDDIRMQYDEKLKMSYQDGMRRQSVSERKSDATKIRELINEKDNLGTRLLELEIKYDKDTKAYLEKIKELKAIIEEMRGGHSNDKNSNSDYSSTSENLLALGDDEKKKLEEIQEQIKRYERRIDYYQQKSLRENCAESERVSELQSDVVNLHNQIETIKNNRRKAVYEKEKKEKPSLAKQGRRHTDSSALRRHTDTEADKYMIKKERDPRQRWSDLEERTEVITRSISELEGKRNPRLTTSKAEGKSGTVLARKTLWENITEEPKTRKTTNADVK